MLNSKTVQSTLQDAINRELTLALQYRLCALQLKIIGIKISQDVGAIGDQCGKIAEALAGKLMFAKGDPVYAPASAETYDTVMAGLTALEAAESKIVDFYADFVKTMWDEGDMANFHFGQHTSKWHQLGGNGYIGHLGWIRKQIGLIKEIGEPEYIAETLCEGPSGTDSQG